MIDVTERARQELKKIATEKVDMPQARLRLIANDKGGLGLAIDIEASGDQVVDYQGSKVLIVEPRLAANLKGVTLDVDDTSEGAELVICEKT